MSGASGRREGVWQRLITDDGTVVHAEHRPPPSGDRALAIVVVHGFTLHSGHFYIQRVARWLDGHPPVITGTLGAMSVETADDHWGELGTGLILLDMRGHGRSAGESTLGWYEVLDVAAAVQWARALGYRRIATLGFSLGAAVALRHAALCGGVDRVAAVSGPDQWYFRGTSRMRLLHHVVLSAAGRLAVRVVRGTRISSSTWTEPLPIDPATAASRVAVPLLVVHGDEDDLFPPGHAERIGAAAANGEVWVVPGFGHAEAALDKALTRRLKSWLVSSRNT